MIFVNLIYKLFYILMAQYCQAKKNCAFQDCAETMLQLHTVRTGIPDTPQTRLTASSFHEYPSDTPSHPLNTPQTSPGNSRYQQTTTDDNRRQQKPTETLRNWQVLFECVWRCLLAHVVVCWHLEFPGDVWELFRGCLGGVWGYMSGIHGN